MTVTMLDQLGGEPALHKLVTRFYDLVETLPEAAPLRELHQEGHGLAHTRIEQFDFLSGFMGGRQHYLEKHGHMNVKKIHEHVPVFEADAQLWLSTMDRALDELGHQGPHIDKLRQAFHRVATMLVNNGNVVGENPQ